MKKNILFIMGSLENGGGEKSLINLLNLIDYEKYNVDLLLFQNKGLFLTQVPKEVNMLNDMKEIHILYDNNIKHLFKLKDIKYRIIHLYATSISRLKTNSIYEKGQYRWKNIYNKIIPAIKKKYDVAISYLEGECTNFLVDKVDAYKKIAFIHTDFSKINADIDEAKQYFLKLDNIVCISHKCVEIFNNIYPSLKNKVVFLPNLNSEKQIKKLAKEFYPNEYNFDGIKILSIGRLVKLKGFDLAIETAAMLKKQGINFKWYILGDGEEKENLTKLIKERKLNKDFFLLGSKENPYPYIDKCDILVQTSIYEGKSMVLDEAKILGKPIVVTNYDTVNDQVKPDDGIIVNMDANSISEGIKDMINSKQKYIENIKHKKYGNESDIQLYYDLFDK